MSAPNDDSLSHISRVLSRLDSIKEKLAILAVACVKGVTCPSEDYDAQSIATEFFSSAEIDQLLGSLRAAGLYVEPFFSEIDFIKFVHSAGMQNVRQPLKVVYNTAHSGTGPGRKSLLPSFCALHKLPITGSDAYVVSLARHKFHVACLLQSFSLPTPETWFYVDGLGWADSNRPSIGKRVIAKPIYESASIGINANSVFTVDKSLDCNVEKIARGFRQPVIIQAFIPGLEVEVPVILTEPPFAPMAVGISSDGRDVLGDGFLTYDAVAKDNYNFWDLSLKDERLAKTLQGHAVRAARLLGIRGFARIDFRVNTAGTPFIFDVSTSPHIVEHSSYAFAFRHLKRPPKELPLLLVAMSCEREGWL